MGKREFSRTIEVIRILAEAQHKYSCVEQWMDSDPSAERLSHAVTTAAKAEALLGLVEVHHCGSFGGHGPGQTQEQRRNFEARLGYLCTIYGTTPEKLRKGYAEYKLRP